MEGKSVAVQPRLIIHGGAGNITRDNLSQKQWEAYKQDLLDILRSTNDLLVQHGATALDAATHAVQLFEANPKFNAGKGAVFTRSGHTELEASVMVSNGFRKRGAAVSLLKHVKSPVSLAAEILKRGENDDNSGAQGHVHISGPSAEELAGSYGLEMCDESYFWTQKRWEEHKRGLNKVAGEDAQWPALDQAWDGTEYLPQGTVGCAVLDKYGTVAVATSTGGITNKLDGRIGDTPTFGAGFWAEEWFTRRHTAPSTSMIGDVLSTISDCLPVLPNVYNPLALGPPPRPVRHAVGLLGTGNGDSFLRVAATRSAAAAARFANVPLAQAVNLMAGTGGELQRSAGDRWHKTGEGEGGIIGIEFVDGRGRPLFDFNCGGLFRAWIDDAGKDHAMVFKEAY